jgi:hypothetical protein
VERPAEGAQAGEADIEADVGHAAVGGTQEEHRPFDTAALQVAMRRFAERRMKRATEVRLGHLRNPREARDVEWLPKVAVHRVPSAEHPTIALFHDSSHHFESRHWREQHKRTRLIFTGRLHDDNNEGIDPYLRV